MFCDTHRECVLASMEYLIVGFLLNAYFGAMRGLEF